MVENTATDPALLAAMSVDPQDYGGDARPPADAADAAQAEPGADAGAEEDTGLGDLTSEELVADIQRNISCIAFCHARVIALIDEVERRGLWAQWVGVTSLPQWVMHIAAVSAHTAREYVRVMMALREMPKVRESLGEGNVSFSKVREVTRLVGRIPDEEALRLADVSTGSQIGVIARNYLQLSAANEDGEAPCALPSDSVSMRTTEPGRTRITIDLGEDEAAEFSSMLDAARHVIEQQVLPDDAGGAEQEDTPSHEPISQVMCLLEIVHAFPQAESPGTVDVDRARMLVHASAEVVTRFGARAEALENVPTGTSADRKKDLTCRIDGFGGITSATAERLSCEALISGTIKDADGDVLMLGRSKRLVSRRQRLALSARDMGCQFPGCRARRRCDAHHIRPWSQGGATDLDNLILLCRTHHTAVHKYELNISRTSAAFAGALGGQAAFAFFLPDGSQLLPLEEGKRGRLVFDTARLVRVAEEAVAEADPSTVGGGYGFSLDYCIAWMFEAEWRHARANNVAA